MEFISKYNLTFIQFVNKKYSKRFQTFDSYALWLYEIEEFENSRYYDKLEEDIKEYSNIQTERKYNYGKSKRENT